MKKLLAVIDMQNDFIDGALGTKEAVALVPAVAARIRAFDGDVVYTQDTHGADYLNTNEGRRLPVPHCIKGTPGWAIRGEVLAAGAGKTVACIEKNYFGTPELPALIERNGYESVELIGLCTDICVISNAFGIRSVLPEFPVSIRAHCCAGVTPESHENALNAMRACMIDILE